MIVGTFMYAVSKSGLYSLLTQACQVIVVLGSQSAQILAPPASLR